jgi:hypothetical protein
VADRVLGGIGCATGTRGLCISGGLAVDKADSLYVADIFNNRIVGFDQPMRRDAVADRVLGADGFHRRVCSNAPLGTTCFSEENHTHPGLNIYGGSLAMDAGGRLLVGNGRSVFVFERPLQAPGRSRRLIDLSPIDDSYLAARALAVDSSGRVLVGLGQHVYGFSRSGAGPLFTLGATCTYSYFTGTPENLTSATLCGVLGLAVGPGDELFVSDPGTNRVVVFERP